MELTQGTLLGGRVRYAQPADGYRTGLEPVLLAASVPAVAGDRVLEAGTGAGATLLCLAARVPGIAGTGLDLSADMAALAASNFAANNHAASLEAAAADLLAWSPPAPFDHAFANPPWFDAAGSPSPQPLRRLAMQAPPGLLQAWVTALAKCLRPKGTLSLILPAAMLGEAAAAMRAAKCGGMTLLAFHPRAGRDAKVMILQGIRLGRGPGRILPGMVLHDADGLTSEAESVLREGVALRLRPAKVGA